MLVILRENCVYFPQDPIAAAPGQALDDKLENIRRSSLLSLITDVLTEH